MRPPLAANMARAYDPLMGAFLQPDPMDSEGRSMPEAYAYGRWSPVGVVDTNGAKSTDVAPQEFAHPNKECRPVKGFEDYAKSMTGSLQSAIDSAANDIAKCTSGLCGLSAAGRNLKRAWLYFLNNDNYYCVGYGGSAWAWTVTSPEGLFISSDDELAGAFTKTEILVKGMTPATFLPPIAFRYWYVHNNAGGYVDCPARLVAHESLHAVLHNMTYDQLISDSGMIPDNPADYVTPTTDSLPRPLMSDLFNGIPMYNEEDAVVELSKCVGC